GLLQGDFLGFGGLENVRFRSPVRPGDRLVLVGKALRLNRRQTVFNVQGFVAGTMVFHGDVLGVPLQRQGPAVEAGEGGWPCPAPPACRRRSRRPPSCPPPPPPTRRRRRTTGPACSATPTRSRSRSASARGCSCSPRRRPARASTLSASKSSGNINSSPRRARP